MKVYILPGQQAVFQKKIALATKHLEKAPAITFHPVEWQTERTAVVSRDDEGRKTAGMSKRKIQVVPVEIENITSGDWILVANVFYNEGLVTTVDTKRFGEIPAKFGLNYFKCDYCGHTHKDRTRAHIIYNTRTGEWKQIGTTCGKRIFQNGDIASFVVKLYKIVDMCGGCMEEDFFGWCAKQPDHSWSVAYPVMRAINTVIDYRKNISREWQKPLYNERGIKVEEGTTIIIKPFLEAGNAPENPNMGAKVVEFVKSLPDDGEWDEYRNDWSGFNTKIKKAFEDGYIFPKDIFTVFFAVKMYEESLTFGDWEKAVKQYRVNEYVDIKNAKLISKTFYEGFYGCGYFVKFDCNGVVLTKDISNWSGFERKFMTDDKTFTFSALVTNINNNNRTVKLGGRVRKCA